MARKPKRIHEDKIRAQLQASLAEIGLTWDQLKASVDSCGCCLTVADDIASKAERIWFTYDDLGDQLLAGT